MEPRAGLILANRAYLDHSLPPGSAEPPSPPGGGLVAALRAAVAPGVSTRDTVWIGAGRGEADRAHVDDSGREIIATARGPLQHRRLFFDDRTWASHYAAVSNEFLWPLLHLGQRDLPEVTDYYPRPALPGDNDWIAYERVNRAFSAAAMEENPGRTAWVHDYQLALVPGLLRQSGFRDPIGFFLHTPFPSIEIAARYLPSAEVRMFRAWCEGMLGADLIAFQTEEDVERFRVAAVEFGAVLRVDGLSFGDRQVELRAIPVGIDVAAPGQETSGGMSTVLAEAVGLARIRDLRLVVALERADYTKGIPERHRALADAARRGVRFAYLGISAPTRAGVAGYDKLGKVIADSAAMAGDIIRLAGGSFDYRQVSVNWSDVVGLLSEADVVFTASLADGMNLVPLQAAVAQSQRPRMERGTIMSGRGAGVSSAYRDMERDGLISVDPLDMEQTTETLIAAIEGRLDRTSDRLVAAVNRKSAQAWATEFLGELEGTRC